VTRVILITLVILTCLILPSRHTHTHTYTVSIPSRRWSDGSLIIIMRICNYLRIAV